MSCNDELDLREHFYQARQYLVLVGCMQMQVDLVNYYNPANVAGIGELGAREFKVPQD